VSLQSDADRTFLALCLWRECRGESRAGKEAVAHSIMNRLASPSWGDSIHSVLFQRLQYSSLTHGQDPQLTNWPLSTDASWKECLQVADAVISGAMPSPIGKADSYHDTSIKPPNWATPQSFVAQIGKLKFYKVGK
jgi:spore germination cell wall hydrolase CwlJ-like protein